MVAQFYHDVALLPVITDQEMGSAMQQLSSQQVEEFDTVAALKELYIYVTKYREEVTYCMKYYCIIIVSLHVVDSKCLEYGLELPSVALGA